MLRGFPGNLKKAFSTNTTVFETAFDGECEAYLARKLKDYPVALMCKEPFRNGLYATTDLKQGQSLFREKPLLRFPPQGRHQKDHRVISVAEASPGIEFLEDFALVAQAVASIVDDPVKTESQKEVSFANRSVPLRCLGWTIVEEIVNSSIEQKAQFVLTDAIGVHFTLGNEWTKEECEKLYNKVKTNMFQSNMGITTVYEAASMLNHSCQPNVGYNPSNENEICALSNISKGEQLFISYQVMDPKRDLPELYGFNCNCPRCRR